MLVLRGGQQASAHMLAILLLALLLLLVQQLTKPARPMGVPMSIIPLAHPMLVIILLPLLLLLVGPLLTKLARLVDLPMPVTPLAYPMPVITWGALLLLLLVVVRAQCTMLALIILAVSTQALLTTPPHIRWRHCLLYLPAVWHDFLKLWLPHTCVTSWCVSPALFCEA